MPFKKGFPVEAGWLAGWLADWLAEWLAGRHKRISQNFIVMLMSLRPKRVGPKQVWLEFA